MTKPVSQGGDWIEALAEAGRRYGEAINADIQRPEPSPVRDREQQIQAVVKAVHPGSISRPAAERIVDALLSQPDPEVERRRVQQIRGDRLEISRLQSLVDQARQRAERAEERLRAIEAERDTFEAALRAIRGPMSDPSGLDWRMAAYRAAGGGYEGLQAIAAAVLSRGGPVTLPGDLPWPRDQKTLRRRAASPGRGDPIDEVIQPLLGTRLTDFDRSWISGWREESPVGCSHITLAFTRDDDQDTLLEIAFEIQSNGLPVMVATTKRLGAQEFDLHSLSTYETSRGLCHSVQLPPEHPAYDNPRSLVGQEVSIDGHRFTVKGVETFAVSEGHPALHGPCGLLVEAPQESHD